MPTADRLIEKWTQRAIDYRRHEAEARRFKDTVHKAIASEYRQMAVTLEECVADLIGAHLPSP